MASAFCFSALTKVSPFPGDILAIESKNRNFFGSLISEISENPGSKLYKTKYRSSLLQTGQLILVALVDGKCHSALVVSFIMNFSPCRRMVCKLSELILHYWASSCRPFIW